MGLIVRKNYIKYNNLGIYTICLQFFVAFLSLPFYIGLWGFLNPFIKYMGILIYLLFEIFLNLTSISDPGVVTKEYYLENYRPDKILIKNYRICRKCNIVMDLDKNTEHCVECGICVLWNDHHCPWTSKCVGKKNLWLFNFFIFFLFTHIAYLIFALVSLAVVSEMKYKNNKDKL